MRFSFLKLAVGTGAAAAVLAGSGWLVFRELDRAFPLPTGMPVSAEVLDRNGALLRAFAAPDKRWRLATDATAVDPALVRMLIAYEDKRFYEHRGVDLLALARATGQFVTHGRIVSGGSTLSMQLARLIEPRTERSLRAKARHMLRAVQIERQWAKGEILKRYLTLAPYGGNLEGVRAASLAWFGKEPKRLTTGQAALLVSLPQLPERRRPDRFPLAAKAARARVLQRMVSAGLRNTSEAARAPPRASPCRPLPPMSRKPPCATAPARS